MLRRLLWGTVALGLLPVAAEPEAATDPLPFDEHPYVGLALFAVDGSVSHTCSGAFLSPKIFLTAGHCTAGADLAIVWTEFGEAFDMRSAIGGAPVTHPGFDAAVWSSANDLGVVILDEPADLTGYATLPALGAFDGLVAGGAAGAPGGFTAVGFGVEAVVPFMQDQYVRVVTVPVAVELGEPSGDGSTLTFASPLAGRTREGACMGDGGRPVFIGSSGVLAGLASAVVGGPTCSGSGFYTRVDTPWAQEFIRGFLR